MTYNGTNNIKIWFHKPHTYSISPCSYRTGYFNQYLTYILISYSPKLETWDILYRLKVQFQKATWNFRGKTGAHISEKFIEFLRNVRIHLTALNVTDT